MSKIEIFIPLTGQTAALEARFKSSPLVVMNEHSSPVGPELPSTGLTEDEILAFALDIAKEKADSFESELECVFFGEITDHEGTQIGWEFEFLVFGDD